MGICVESEIGRLKKVLLHRPGAELEHLVPEVLERLLFDDIPFLEIAQQEHDYFAEQLRNNDVEVIYLEDLVADVLEKKPDLKKAFVNEFINNSGSLALNYAEQIKEYLLDIKDSKQMVLKTMHGIYADALDSMPLQPLTSKLDRNYRFILDPIPNLYFTRDTFASIGKGVSLNKMYSKTRRRESIYGKYIFNFHPEYKTTPLYYLPDLPFSIEGGDILNLSNEVLCIGISQRTSSEAIELLAQTIISDPACDIKTIIAFEIPRTRAFMHLDTVFTQVDYNKFTIHPEIISNLRSFELTMKNNNLCVKELEDDLALILARYIHVDKVSLIRCGGFDRVAGAREQWNDGSNTLCIAPGLVVVYDRNIVTNKLLEDSGVRTIKIKSSELSRGRGGPRCMSMPLERECMRCI